MGTRILFTSVPAEDHALVRALVPDAAVTEARLGPRLAARYPDVEALAVMIHDPVDVAVLERFAHLRGVVTRSTGYDHLPLDWLRKANVAACHLPEYAVSSVAHLTVALILSMLRRVPEAIAVTQGAARGGIDPPTWDRSGLVGRHLHDVTVGVLGTGSIGSEVVRSLAALGADVVGFDVAPRPELVRVSGFRYVAPLSAFLAASDVLTVHVPLTADTRGLIGSDALGRLPRGAILVNTARGGVVDQRAVEGALRQGRLAGYAADVLPREPRCPDITRFRDFTNVVLTPHLGAYDGRAIATRYRHTARAIEAILQRAQDRPVPYLVPAHNVL